MLQSKLTKRFIKEKSEKRHMVVKEAQAGTSGISRLSKSELKQYEGKCVGIVEGKVMFSGKDASKILQQLMEYKESKDKIFSCIPAG